MMETQSTPTKVKNNAKDVCSHHLFNIVLEVLNGSKTREGKKDTMKKKREEIKVSLLAVDEFMYVRLQRRYQKTPTANKYVVHNI